MKKLTWKVQIPKIDHFNNASRAARAAQKVVLEEIYLLEAKIWRIPGIIPSEALALKHKCSTEILSWGGGEGEDEDHLPAAIKELPDGLAKQIAIVGSSDPDSP